MQIVYTLAVSMAIALPFASGAAASSAQHPSLLSGYAVRPSWTVAGVDYAVGMPANTRLIDAATMNVAGVSVNPSGHQIIVAGDNVVLSNYDFSTSGGWDVYVEGTNDTIENSYFKVGSNNQVPIVTSSGASALSILHNTIDGGGVGVDGNPSAIWSLIDSNGTGLTARYNWLKYAPQHIIEFRAGKLLDDHNLIESVGFFQGAHVNDVQFNGGVSNGSVIAFNTVYNPQPTGGLPTTGEGIQVEAQLNATITNTRVEKNTVIATGPQLTASYLICLHQDPGQNLLRGVQVRDNYLDSSGAYGPIYPNPTGSNLTFVNNIDMVTGKTIAAPGSAIIKARRPR